DYQQRAGIFVSERSSRRKSQPSISPGGHKIESRRDRRGRQNLLQRTDAEPHGTRGLELFVAVGVAGDLWPGQARPDRAGYGGMAQWAHRGVQTAGGRKGLPNY